MEIQSRIPYGPFLAAAALVIVVLAASAWFLAGNGGDEVSSARTFTALRGPLTIDVNESGTIRAREQLISMVRRPDRITR